MRPFRYTAFAFLALMLAGTAMAADEPASRNFGTVPCGQKFSCAETQMPQLAEMANNCTVSGFGISSQRTGIFDSASLDSNNCMSGQLPPAPGRAMTPQCCIVPMDSDTCTMRCNLLMY